MAGIQRKEDEVQKEVHGASRHERNCGSLSLEECLLHWCSRQHRAWIVFGVRVGGDNAK